MAAMVVALFFVSLLAMTTVPADAQSPEKRRTGNVCSTDVQCPDNAFCKGGSYCVCKDGFVYAAVENAAKVCLKVASYGELCEQNVQCHPILGVNAECYLQKCVCQKQAQFINDRCYKMAAVGERCVVEHNCHLAGASTTEQPFCVRGYCTCPLQFSPRDNGTRCVRDAVLGETCEDSEQCVGAGLTCRGTCQCEAGFIPDGQNNVCMELVDALGKPCEYDDQCKGLAGNKEGRSLGAALCLGGVCACGANNRQAGEPLRCWHIRRPTQTCHRDEQCLGDESEDAYCRDGTCTCPGCIPDFRDFSDTSNVIVCSPFAMAILTIIAVLA